MTFAKFEEIIKNRYPGVTVFQHGEFAGNKVNVSIIFDGEHGRVYQYNGTYCEVLNKLGINVIYKHNYQALVSALERARRENGKTDIFFGGVVDTTKDIEEYTRRLQEIELNYIIV